MIDQLGGFSFLKEEEKILMLTHYTGFQDLNKVKNVSFQIERRRENAGLEVARIKTVFTLLSRVGALMVFKRLRFF